MSYNKNIWKNGDIITESKMNNIENGIYMAHDEINTLKNNTPTGGSNNASDISITDAANNFTATNVEGALQEVGSQIKDIANKFTNVTTPEDSGTNGHNNNNRLPSFPTANTEYEIVISENVTTNEVRWFIDGTLVQDGTTTLLNPLYLANTQGQYRFIGNYSLIEIYNGYCATYDDFIALSN